MSLIFAFFRSSSFVYFKVQAERGLLGTSPPDPTLESTSPSPPQGSIWHRNRVKSGNRCRIDAKSIPRGGEGEADSRVGCGGLCLINPSQSSVFEAVFSEAELGLSPKNPRTLTFLEDHRPRSGPFRGAVF